jgi:hypothetical protein
VSFAAITLCVASQRVFIVVRLYIVVTQSGNFWIHPRSCKDYLLCHKYCLCVWFKLISAVEVTSSRPTSEW